MPLPGSTNAGQRQGLILTLARGHYCPKEHQQHLQRAAFYPHIGVAYTQIVTIATDPHHTLQEFRASGGAQWTFLSDPERIVQKDLEIQEYTDPENDPMIASDDGDIAQAATAGRVPTSHAASRERAIAGHHGEGFGDRDLSVGARVASNSSMTWP